MPWRRLILVLLLIVPLAAQVVDRVAATVNGHAILVSEVDEAARYSAMVEARALATVSNTDRAVALDLLIDQELIRQRLSSAGLLTATDQEVAAQAAAIRTQLSAEKDDAWRTRLTQYGLSEADFAAQLRSQIDQLRFIELRFRPNARVTALEIETYYREQYVPKMRAAGAPEKPLTEVRPQIEEILAQQQVGQQLESWLQALRSEARIRVLVKFAGAAQKPVTAQEGSGR
jgi:hypothetical protein